MYKWRGRIAFHHGGGGVIFYLKVHFVYACPRAAEMGRHVQFSNIRLDRKFST